jgi:putative transposase
MAFPTFHYKNTHPAVKQYDAVSSDGHATNWNAATDKAKITANARKAVITDFIQLVTVNSAAAAYKLFKQRIQEADITPQLQLAITQLKNKVPSANTIKNWMLAFEQNGLNGLLPQHKGSQRKTYGWEVLAIEAYHQPQKPSMRKVAQDLRENHGFKTATNDNVNYFFNTLPAELQDKSRWRLGTKLYRDGQREYNLRHTENLLVGDVYQGDGHTLDLYLRHPNNGALWRAELTVFQDWKSRYIVGWYLSNAESSFTTMAALSRGMAVYDHVPLILYIDNGCGFKSKLMNDAVAGFYATFGIKVIFAIPGNAKAKGNVERFFGYMERDLNKDFDTYCGADMSPDASRLFQTKNIQKMIDAGIRIPTQEEWIEAFENWLIKYHNRPHPEYKNTTPAAMWAGLDRTPVHDSNLLVKPRVTVNVKRASVRFKNRTYRADHLHQFNDKQLIAEYDFHDDSYIRLFHPKGEFITNAQIVIRKEGIPTSFIEEQRIESKKQALKRIDIKRRDVEGRHALISDHEEQLNNLELSTSEFEQHKVPVNDTPEANDFSQLLDDIVNTNVSSNNHDDEFDPIYNIGK